MEIKIMDSYFYLAIFLLFILIFTAVVWMIVRYVIKISPHVRVLPKVRTDTIDGKQELVYYCHLYNRSRTEIEIVEILYDVKHGPQYAVNHAGSGLPLKLEPWHSLEAGDMRLKDPVEEFIGVTAHGLLGTEHSATKRALKRLNAAIH